jgi:hypothetical protein
MVRHDFENGFVSSVIYRTEERTIVRGSGIAALIGVR